VDKEMKKDAGYANDQGQKMIDNCLHVCLQLTANLSIFMNPFLPFTAQKLLHMMKVVEKMLQWENAGKMDLLKENYPLRAPELLFRKIEDEEIDAQIKKLKDGLVLPSTKENAMDLSAPLSTEQDAHLPIKDTIQYDDFAKLDLRVGTIETAEKIKKADKLLQLSVNLGFEVRTIVSGIAEHFSPEEVIGQKVIIEDNLAQRKMRAVESNGMILMSSNKDGKLLFTSPDAQAENGTAVN